eukprot:s2453_g23.t1
MASCASFGASIGDSGNKFPVELYHLVKDIEELISDCSEIRQSLESETPFDRQMARAVAKRLELSKRFTECPQLRQQVKRHGGFCCLVKYGLQSMFRCGSGAGSGRFRQVPGCCGAVPVLVPGGFREVPEGSGVGSWLVPEGSGMLLCGSGSGSGQVLMVTEGCGAGFGLVPGWCGAVPVLVPGEFRNVLV